MVQQPVIHTVRGAVVYRGATGIAIATDQNEAHRIAAALNQYYRRQSEFYHWLALILAAILVFFVTITGLQHETIQFLRNDKITVSR